MDPRFAILTRTYCRPAFLERAMQSVLGQTEQNWVHVILNNGGDRREVEALATRYERAYGGRLQIAHRAEPVGMQDAANICLYEAGSEFVCIHDDDDSWSADFLRTCATFLDREGPASSFQGCITHTQVVEEELTSSGQLRELARRPYIPLEEISLLRMGYENPFPPIAFCYRRSVLEEIGLYNERYGVAGDMDFNFRFLSRFDIGVVPRALAYYHWRVKSADPVAENSVHALEREHRQRLAKLKNAYLRQPAGPAHSALGLGFNLAKFVYDGEWKTAELLQKLRQLHENQSTEATPL